MTRTFEFIYGPPVSAEEAHDRLSRYPSAVIDGLLIQEYGDFSADPPISSLVIATSDWQAVAAALPTYVQAIISERLTAEVNAECVRWVQVRPTRLAGVDDFHGTSYRTEHDDGRPITADDDGAIQVVCVELLPATPTNAVPGTISAVGTR